MIQISPLTLGDLGKRILTNISKYIQQTHEEEEENDDEDNVSSSFFHGHFTFLPDEPHADPEISADTRVKRELIKAMTRAVLGLKENAKNLFNLVYKLIRKCIENNQEFTKNMNENEIIYIRLCGLSCLLKLISNTYFYGFIKPDDFLSIINLLRDPSSIIRQRTYRKLAEHLRDPLCPIEFLALLAFAAKEPEREHREQIRRQMLQIIDTRREHIKLQLSYKTTNEFDEDNEKSIDYTLYPEYSLTYFLFFLSKSPAFILYDDIEMLHTMTDYILFLLDSLLLRCDTTVGLFYKGLLRSIKSAEDATLKLDKEDKKDASKKLHVLVDLAYVILTQRASSLMICRANSNVPLPDTYFKKGRYNHLSYLPKDFQIKLKPITTTTTATTENKRIDMNNTTVVPSNRKRASEKENGNHNNNNDDEDDDDTTVIEQNNNNSKEQKSPNKKQKTTSVNNNNSKQQKKRKRSQSVVENESSK